MMDEKSSLSNQEGQNDFSIDLYVVMCTTICQEQSSIPS